MKDITMTFYNEETADAITAHGKNLVQEVSEKINNYTHIMKDTTKILRINLQIALFMGAINSRHLEFKIKDSEVRIPDHGVCSIDNINFGNNKMMQYHKSWDWLMPVISKIQEHDLYPQYKDESSSQFSDGGIEINTKYLSVTYNSVAEFFDWLSLNDTNNG